MKDRYLEITFRKGKPLAAYLYLTREHGAKSTSTRKISEGLVADFDGDGHPMGLEIASPTAVTVQQVMEALEKLQVGPINEIELAPLKAA